MQDLIERLKIDLNDSSKKSEPFILNWTEAVIRRLWLKAQENAYAVDAELATLGTLAKERCANRAKAFSKSCSSL